MQIIKYMKNGHIHLKVKDYFSNPKHNEKEYTDGKYLTSCSIRNWTFSRNGLENMHAIRSSS